MYRQLTISNVAMQQALRPTRLNSTMPIFCPVGIVRSPSRIEWLIHNIPTISGTPSHDEPTLAIVLSDQPHDFEQNPILPDSSLQEGVFGFLRLGVGPCAGRLQAARFVEGRAYPFDRVRILAPQLPTFGATPPTLSLADREMWSRSIGALGEKAWTTLQGLHVGIIGCGRSGSHLASALVRSGIKNLTLLDADNVELHNLGEMELVRHTDLGRPKVDALRDALNHTYSNLNIATEVASIGQLIGATKIKPCDILFAGVDNPEARLAVATVAVLFLKPLIDIGVGVQHNPYRWGADIRFALPGNCPLCLGGITDAQRGLAIMFGEQAPPQRNWQQERAGSLASLNGLATHFAIRLLEEWIAGHLRQSTWLHLEANSTTQTQLELRPPRSNCPLCQLTGTGDNGLLRFQTQLRQAS